MRYVFLCRGLVGRPQVASDIQKVYRKSGGYENSDKMNRIWIYEKHFWRAKMQQHME
jgi:hypothetical protein